MKPTFNGAQIWLALLLPADAVVLRARELRSKIALDASVVAMKAAGLPDRVKKRQYIDMELSYRTIDQTIEPRKRSALTPPLAAG
ncbi:MAG: hypothetical protein MZU95_02425 [Desulfomicrobium escambiense]|nr:hypothetical protein [Desulfomicrobium escambiense]